MVESTDYFTNLVVHRKGLTEAELLPLLTVRELVVFASLNRASRSLCSPSSGHHINFAKVFVDRLRQMSYTDAELEPIYLEFADVGTWRQVLEIAKKYTCDKLVLVPEQHLGHTYTRFNLMLKHKEYLSYAGGNESWHTNNP